jgi:hypothetical protein
VSKTRELITSRRLWAALAGIVAAVVLFSRGMIDADQMSKWIETALELYAGSIGFEHAAKVWRANAQEGGGK